MTEKEEKVIRTDKVIIGSKTSWAVAQAIGEVSDYQMGRAE